jgi:hypothetical protein
MKMSTALAFFTRSNQLLLLSAYHDEHLSLRARDGENVAFRVLIFSIMRIIDHIFAREWSE